MKFKDIELPRNKNFGLFFSFVFLLLSGYFYFVDSLSISIILLTISILFFIFSRAFPRLLKPLNILWMFIGYLLGRIISPIILGVIFYFLITPFGLVMRVFGRDELNLKDKPRTSYWDERTPIGPRSKSFKDQF
tara:strand:- start:776 stop:1177 length:402 start_codon:yes stop_codon:yes gene_type:complete